MSGTPPAGENAEPDRLARLIEAIAQRRDKAAFARLFDYYAPRLRAYFLRLGTAASAADDLVQETMLRLWRNAGQFDSLSGSASAWIFVIARNLRIDRMRRERAGAAASLEASDEPAAAADGEAALIGAERRRRLRAALAALPEEQAMILRLSFFEGRPHGEIARTLGLPLGTVKSRARLAVNRLRAMMDESE